MLCCLALACRQVSRGEPKLLRGDWHGGKAACKEAFRQFALAAKGKKHEAAEVAQRRRSELLHLIFTPLIQFDESAHISRLPSGAKRRLQNLWSMLEFLAMLRFPGEHFLPLIRDAVEEGDDRQTHPRFGPLVALEGFRCGGQFASFRQFNRAKNLRLLWPAVRRMQQTDDVSEPAGGWIPLLKHAVVIQFCDDSRDEYEQQPHGGGCVNQWFPFHDPSRHGQHQNQQI